MRAEGVEAIRRNFSLWAAAFDKLHAEIEEYIETPNGVVCAAHWQGQGRASGISIDVRQFDLYEFRDGGSSERFWASARNEALEAAGLSE